MRYLGLIPARGGSKGIPRKNMALLGGKPLIWHTVIAAQKSALKDSLFLSSDSDEIIEYCRQLGLDSKYRRPDNLATDHASTVEVVLDALSHFAKSGVQPENIILLQPTSPLRTSSDIDLAIKAYEGCNLESLVGVNVMREHPYECISASAQGNWSFLRAPSKEASRRQDYSEKFFYLNGAIYIVKTDYFLKHKRFVKEGESFLFEMPSVNGIDIDEPSDMSMAEAHLQSLKQGE